MLFLGGRRSAGRWVRDASDNDVASAVGVVGTGASHVVIAVGPPRRGATGDARLGVRIVIDVGTVRRRRRHGSWRRKKTDKFRFFISLHSRLNNGCLLPHSGNPIS